MRLHIYFIGMIDGRFASDICHTCVIFSTNLYRSCIYTFRRKKFFSHKFHIDRRDSERSSKLPSMNHFTLYKKRIPKQIICLFHIAFYDLFPHKRTADVPSLILDLVYHPKGIAICRGQFFQQNMIPFPVMAKPEIRSDYHALYMQTFYNPCNKSLRLHAHDFFGKRTFQQVINSTLFENFLLFFIGRKDTVIIILRKFFRWNIKRKNNGL